MSDLDLAEIRAHQFPGLGVVAPTPGLFLLAFAKVTGKIWMQQFGVYGCSCVNESLPLLQMVHLIRGDISNSLDVYQGCYHPGVGASAGSHDKGGPVDVGQYKDRHLKTQRECGWGAQHRTKAQGFSADHNHMFPIGCTHGSPLANSQQRAWRNGRNGLVSNGKITGPGPIGSDTPHWKEGVRLMEKEIMAFKDDVAAEVVTRLRKDYDAIADAVLTRDGKIANTITGNPDNKTVTLAGALTGLGRNTTDIGTQVNGWDKIPAPVPDAKNPNWVPVSYLRETFRKLMAHDTQIAAMNAKLDAIIAALKGPQA